MKSNSSSLIRTACVLAVGLIMVFSGCNTGQTTDPEFEEGFVDVNGAKIYYKRYRLASESDTVTSSPILFVHGGPGLDHSYLLPQMADLFAEDHELVFFDQLLSGRSDGAVDTSRIRVESFVNDIETLRQELNLGKVHVLGHSWGGLLAMHYALRYPANVGSLLLVGSLGPASEMWGQEDEIMRNRYTPYDNTSAAEIRSSVAFANEEPSTAEDLFRISFKRQFVDTTKLDQLTMTLPDSFFVNAMRFQYIGVDLVSYDLRPPLRELNVPTLIVYGDYDALDVISGPVLNESIAGSKRVTIDDAGHFPYIEQPGEFREAVNSYLQCAPSC